MSFFEQQYHARRATRLLVFYFFLAVVGIILSTYGLIYLLFASARNSSVATGAALDFRSPEMFFLVTAVVTIIVSLGSLYKILQLRSGGVTVAQNLGARPVHPDTEDYYERRFLNIVEEMSVASGVPVPSVFVMEESGINAFAAGYAPDTAVVTVSRGALQMLTRSELQGVVAHEFSHILNGDMKLNIRLIGLVHGILVIALIGYQLMRVLGNLALTDRDKVFGAAQHAWRGAANLDVSYFADGSQLEHRVEGRDFIDTDVGHAEHFGDIADRRLRQPAVVLFLGAPQQRNDRRGLLPGRIIFDLRLGPGKIIGREFEAGGLLGMQATDGHRGSSVLECLARGTQTATKPEASALRRGTST